MGKLNKFMYTWLAIALIFWLFYLLFIESQSHLIAYYLWIPFVGGFVFLFRERIRRLFENSKLSPTSKFMISGIVMIILQSIIAALSNQAKIYQFLIHDFLIFIPWLTTWYFILSKIEFSKNEIFVFVGIQGLVMEGIYLQLNIFLPLFIPMTVFFYWVMMYPSLIVKELYFNGRSMSKIKKYMIALILPIVVVLIFQIVSDMLRQRYPSLFSSKNY